MDIKKILLGIGSAAVIGIVATAGIAHAYQGDPTKQGPHYSADMHDLKVNAFNAQDFEVWKDLMEQSGSNGRVLEVVNAENFNTFVKAHNAAMEGDLELSQELRAELGLGLHDGSSQGRMGSGSGRGNGLHDGSAQESGQRNKAKGSRDGTGFANQENFIDSDGNGVCDNFE